MKIYFAAFLAAPIYTSAFQQAAKTSLRSVNSGRQAIAIPSPISGDVVSSPQEPQDDEVDMTGIALSVGDVEQLLTGYVLLGVNPSTHMTHTNERYRTNFATL